MHTGPVGYGLRSVNYLPPVADDAHADGDVDDILNRAIGGSGKNHKHGSKRKLSIPEGVDPLSEDYQVRHMIQPTTPHSTLIHPTTYYPSSYTSLVLLPPTHFHPPCFYFTH